MTSTRRDVLTMLIAILASAAVLGFLNQPWWVGSLVAVAVLVGLRSLWPAPQSPDRGSLREEAGMAERSDQQRRLTAE